ncbi:hypothetical protein [Actinophytocola sp.]|uniref:hypothetical protein n=1 Tax=Actinophytocola sp. TaxID=1872138 RepID=UPI003899B5E1
MFRKTIVVSALAGLLTLGAAGVASAADTPTDDWVPIFYFGNYCQQAGSKGEQAGVLTPGDWKCDHGWLMVKAPESH